MCRICSTRSSRMCSKSSCSASLQSFVLNMRRWRVLEHDWECTALHSTTHSTPPPLFMTRSPDKGLSRVTVSLYYSLTHSLSRSLSLPRPLRLAMLYYCTATTLPITTVVVLLLLLRLPITHGLRSSSSSSRRGCCSSTLATAWSSLQVSTKVYIVC